MSKEHENIGSCKENCGSCNLCCLFVCKHCGLFEGALTTHCPAEPVAYGVSDRIYKGEINYRGNIWIEGECTEHSPAFYHKHEKEMEAQHNLKPQTPHGT